MTLIDQSAKLCFPASYNIVNIPTVLRRILHLNLPLSMYCCVGNQYGKYELFPGVSVADKIH
uniref:Uncharacterized protein n=1 Tax=Anguilla anguilla TaxID=7936 RepID=A0A0E9QG29_ANGAN